MGRAKSRRCVLFFSVARTGSSTFSASASRLPRVPRGFRLGPHLSDPPVRADQQRAAHDPQERFSQETASCAARRTLRSPEIADRSAAGSSVCTCMRISPAVHAVRAAAQNHRSALVELRFGVAKFRGFVDASRRQRLGKKIQHHGLAAQIGKRDFACRPRVGKPEIRRLSPSCSIVVSPFAMLAVAIRQQSFQCFVHHLRIGLAARRAHHLPHEKLEYALIPRAVLGHIVGILFDHFAADLLDLPRIIDSVAAPRRPRFPWRSCRVSNMFFKTAFELAPVIFSSAVSTASSANCCGVTGLSAGPLPRSFQCRSRSVCI